MYHFKKRQIIDFAWQMLSIKAKRVNLFLSSAMHKEERSRYRPRLRGALVILGDAMLAVALVLLLEIDKLVNSTLYGYGLVFSYDWTQPYWLMFRVTLALIIVAVILISVIELPYPALEEKTEEEA